MSSHLYPIYFYEFYLLLPFLVLQKRISLKTKRPVHYINTNNTFQKIYPYRHLLYGYIVYSTQREISTVSPISLLI